MNSSSTDNQFFLSYFSFTKEIAFLFSFLMQFPKEKEEKIKELLVEED